MKNKERKQLMSSFSGLGLLLYAIMPVIENTDWLFYTCAGLMILSFCIFLAGSVFVYREEHGKIMTYLSGTPRDKIYQIFISLTGIAIYFSMNRSGLSWTWIWWAILITDLLELVSPVKEVKKDEPDSGIM